MIIGDRMKTPKTLAMIKMEKNFIAQIDKDYPRYPYSKYSVEFLRKRLLEETVELNNALKKGDFQNAKLECGDVSNVIDYIFEKLSQRKLRKKGRDNDGRGKSF